VGKALETTKFAFGANEKPVDVCMVVFCDIIQSRPVEAQGKGNPLWQGDKDTGWCPPVASAEFSQPSDTIHNEKKLS
jgi:hypothetical protein